MSRGFTSTYQAVNLIRNGNLDMVETREDGTKDAHFWHMTDLSQVESQTTVVDNMLELVQVEPGVAPANRFRIQLAASKAALLYQDLRRSASTHVMDFQVPLTPGLRSSLASGYLSTETHTLPAANYTLAFSMRVTQGEVRINAATWDLHGVRTVPTYMPGGGEVVAGPGSSWKRSVLTFTTDQGLGQVGLELRRVAGQDLTVVEIGLVALALGRYRSLPYTGDPLVGALPVGAIILSLGQACPPGFVELGEGGLEPLSDWTSDEPAVKARKGNYPRSGSEQVGTTTHGVDQLELAPGQTDALSFYGPDSKTAKDANLVDMGFANPAVDKPGGPQGAPLHEHSMEAAGTRPVSRSYLFCKRI